VVGYSGLVEQFYTALLVAVAVAVAWFACYVVYRLFGDHR
jgi:NO-binding membrane sensor protein with MHYT domain